MRTKSVLTCPLCGADFSTDRVKELGRYFFRRQADCSSCGRMLSYAKWPWWLLNAGCLATFLAHAFGIVFLFLGFGKIDSPWRGWFNLCPALLLVAGLFFWPAVRYNRLVCEDPVEIKGKEGGTAFDRASSRDDPADMEDVG